MLAKNYKPDKHESKVLGWYMSEKLDGVRAVFDGKQFYTRNGNVLDAPWRFVGPLTNLKIPGGFLDGELYIGRGAFSECSGIVRRHGDEWFDIQYHVFDLPCQDYSFAGRCMLLENLVDESSVPHLFYVEQVQIEDSAQLYAYQETLVADGAEGLMLKNPASVYQQKRSGDLLKLKKFHDMEAFCFDYQEGLGKYKDMMGALVCKTADGKVFNVGSGFVDSDRVDFGKFLGQTITVKYFELSKDGIPRFPIFKGIRYDL